MSSKISLRLIPILMASPVLGAFAAGPIQAEEVGPPVLEDSGPIQVVGQSNITISKKRITNPNGNCITVTGSATVLIENSYIGPCAGEAISVANSNDVTVRNSYIKDVRTGLYAYKSTRMRYYNNTTKNVRGPRPRGQMVQFNNVTGARNEIYHNVAINEPEKSNPEDVINLYQSVGTSSSPILVAENYIKGGGPSGSGGGIMLGDNGGGYQRAVQNILVDPGQYGMAIAGGKQIVISNNQVYARQQSFTNIGIYVWAQAGATCSDAEVSFNTVGYFNRNGINNGWWDGKNCGAINQSNNRFDDQYKIPPVPSHWGPTWVAPAGF